jgi:hypothetical protein
VRHILLKRHPYLSFSAPPLAQISLFAEPMLALLDGNLEEGRAALRSYIRATVDFTVA